MPFRLILCLIVASFTLLTASCSDSIDPADTDYDTAVQLMDKGEYSSAIYILEGHLVSHPEDMDHQVLLASAYAGRAGVLFSDFIDVAEALSTSASRVDQYFSRNGLIRIAEVKSDNKSNTDKALEFLERLYKSLYQVNEVIHAFKLIPVVTQANQLKDLKHAIDLLDEVHYSYAGGVLYRGLLRISLLKYKIRNDFKFEFDDRCITNNQNLIQEVKELHNHLTNIYVDLINSSVNDQRRIKIRSSQKQVDKALNDLAQILKSSPHFDISKINGISTKDCF